MNSEIGKKEEIISLAQQLFFSKGYDKASIQNIIDAANIAKGTFYHYFKSKEDLLNQLTEIKVDTLYRELQKIVTGELNGLEKMNTIFHLASEWKSMNPQLMKVLVRSMMSDHNLKLRHVMMQMSRKRFIPFYKEVIEQGNSEGVFNVTDPEFTAGFILSSFSVNSEEMFEVLTADVYTEELFQQLKSIITNFEEMLNRILGCKSGGVNIIEDDVLDRLLKGLLEA